MKPIDQESIESKRFIAADASDERKVTLVAIAYFFCVICSYYVIKPIRGSLALELGAASIPVLNILSMISLIAGNAIYSIIVGRYKRDIFIPFITRFFVFCLLGFWILFTFILPVGSGITGRPSMLATLCIGSYYLWVNLFALLAVSMFWSFMNDVFTVNQSRRLYAIIGYGGLIGGLAGSLVTVVLAKMLGTANLFLVAAVMLYPSIWCMQYIHRRHYRHDGVPEVDNKAVAPAHPPRPWDGFVAVAKNPVLIFMAFEMFFYTFSSTLFFQQLNQILETAFAEDIDGRTAFVAGIYSRINVISLFTQFFVTRLVMSLRNPVVGLLMLNLIQVIGTLCMMASPGLGVVSWTIIIRYALNYSTGRAMRELIYIPLDREAKYQGKGFIDTVVFRLGDGLSSVMLIGGLEMFSYGPWIDHSILITMAIQFYVIIKVAGLYGRRLNETAAPETVSVSAD